jgi:putative DNA-invertase from lambdoid prophage Rac
MSRRHKPPEAAQAAPIPTPGGPQRLVYFRVSSDGQSIEAQRTELGAAVHGAREFIDHDVSGMIPMAKRPGFSALLAQAREGDVLHVAAVDRLGRDAIDVQATVRRLIQAGVNVDIRGLGIIGRGVGELIVAVLAQVADMERARILERANAGRAAARASLALTGKTHRGKDSLGRPFAADLQTVVAWRERNQASIATTARHFEIAEATVKRYCQIARKEAA